MKELLLISIILLSISKGYGQDLSDIFSYQKAQFSSTIVKNGVIDSLTNFEKVVLEGLDSKIPFYHFLNQRNAERNYAILIHGLGGNKMYWIYPSMPYLQYTTNLTAIKDSLLDLGFNLVIIDAKYHGERAYEFNFRDPSYLPPQRSQNEKDANLFYDMYVSTVKELRLIMDYIEQVHQNSIIKFNLVGYSMGGGISLLLNSIDNRINSVVACVPPMGRPYTELDGPDWPDEIKEKMKAISPLYSAKKQKSPVALIMGKKDIFIPVEEVELYYEKLTIKDKVLKFHDAGHELPDAYINDVIEWITQQTINDNKEDAISR